MPHINNFTTPHSPVSPTGHRNIWGNDYRAYSQVRLLKMHAFIALTRHKPMPSPMYSTTSPVQITQVDLLQHEIAGLRAELR